jgi:hypothetical protein
MADLRHVTIPKSIQFMVNRAPWSFYRCVEHVIGSDQRFNSSGAGIRAGIRILGKIEGKPDGHTEPFDQADWKLLHDAMETPSAGWVFPLGMKNEQTGVEVPLNVPGRTFLSYVDAVSEEATRKPPEKDAKSMNGVDAKPMPEAAQAS